MDKRSLAISLVLLGIGFAGFVHIIADFAYGTGLAGVGIVLVGIAVVGIAFLNR